MARILFVCPRRLSGLPRGADVECHLQWQVGREEGMPVLGLAGVTPPARHNESERKGEQSSSESRETILIMS